jgi:hypothetical protein
LGVGGGGVVGGAGVVGGGGGVGAVGGGVGLGDGGGVGDGVNEIVDETVAVTPVVGGFGPETSVTTTLVDKSVTETESVDATVVVKVVGGAVALAFH